MSTYVGTLGSDNTFLLSDDVQYGLDGDDQLIWRGTGYARLYGGEGHDSIQFLRINSFDTPFGLADGGPGNDYLSADGSGPDIFYGGDDEDVLSPSGGDDFLDGGRGHDLLNAWDGDDILYGGDGLDSLFGGRGDDRLFGGDGDDGLIGGDGSDYLEGGAGDDGMDGDARNAAFNPEDPNEIATHDDYMLGSDGNDRIHGGSGSDGLFGDQGNDWLHGGLGNDFDYLEGGSGDDLLYGAGGNDGLVGGTGFDQFYFFTANEGNDLIVDFVKGEDKLVLDAFPGLTNLVASFNYTVNSSAVAAVATIIYDTQGFLYFDADGTGVGAAVQFATLQNAPLLSTTDFQVI